MSTTNGIHRGRILGAEDRTITPVAQRFMAERSGATVEVVEASHLSLISRPGQVAQLIDQAASTSQKEQRP